MDKYRVKPNQKVHLDDFSTRRDVDMDKKSTVETLMPKNIQKIAALQEKLYAQNQYSLLIVFQAMDAAGKDGAIKHVMTGLNPQGTQVVSFKVPSSTENDHDYLWRIHQQVPARGNIGIFNRSHYEDVIVSRVHDLVENSQLPPALVSGDIWDTRYRQLRQFEQYLVENGTIILKFFLHVSKEEQRQRLLDRITNKEKNWKFSSSDIRERQYWDSYMHAYEQMLENTSQKDAPWYILPADNKWYTRYLVSQIVLDTLEALNPQYPTLAKDEQDKLAKCQAMLEAQKPADK